jgi:hypothetical protein
MHPGVSPDLILSGIRQMAGRSAFLDGRLGIIFDALQPLIAEKRGRTSSSQSVMSAGGKMVKEHTAVAPTKVD